MIILSTGRMPSPLQIASLCLSVLSLSWGASRSFTKCRHSETTTFNRAPQVVLDFETKGHVRSRPETGHGDSPHLAVDVPPHSRLPRSHRRPPWTDHLPGSPALLCSRISLPVAVLQVPKPGLRPRHHQGGDEVVHPPRLGQRHLATGRRWPSATAYLPRQRDRQPRQQSSSSGSRASPGKLRTSSSHIQ